MEKDIQNTWKQKEGGPIKCIMDVGKNSKHLFQKKLGIDGLSGVHGRILGYIFCQEKLGKSVHQKDIEKSSRLSKSSVTSVLQVLEKKGFIKRESENGDARLKKITLTEEGMKIQNEAIQKINFIENQVKSVLTVDEYAAFLESMKKIDNKITELCEKQEV